MNLYDELYKILQLCEEAKKDLHNEFGEFISESRINNINAYITINKIHKIVDKIMKEPTSNFTNNFF